MAAPDAIARLPATGLKGQAREIWNIYFHEQQHSSLAAFMSRVLTLEDFHLNQKRQEGLFVQVRLLYLFLLIHYYVILLYKEKKTHKMSL